MKTATASKPGKTSEKHTKVSSLTGISAKKETATPVSSKGTNGSVSSKSKDIKAKGMNNMSRTIAKSANGKTMGNETKSKSDSVSSKATVPLKDSAKNPLPKDTKASVSAPKTSSNIKDTKAENGAANSTKTSERTSSPTSAPKEPRPATNRPPRRIDEPKKDVTSEFLTFFIDELKDVYWAEQALIDAIVGMRDKASSPKLIDALSHHLSETNGQIVRLEKIFRILGEEPESKTCKAMQGLIDEANDIMNEIEDDLIRDAGIILASQKVEHYEIATYGTLVAFAKVMGRAEVVSLLEQTLQEEKGADAKLTLVAESFVNNRAVTESESTTGEDDGYFSFVRKWISDHF